MTDIKTLQTRIALKYDTYANWTDDTKENQGANLVLLKGEIGICAIDAQRTSDPTVQTPVPTVLFKVGDGTHKFSELKWASALAADVYDWAKKSEDEFKTWLDQTAKFATDEEVAAAVAAEAKLRADADSALDARITAIEGNVGTGNVAGDIEDIKGRLEDIEGDNGTIATGDAATLESAKGYADDVATTAEDNAKKYAKEQADGKDAAIQAAQKAGDDAAAALISYKSEMETALAGKQDVIPANTYDAYGSADQALVDAKAYADQAELDAIAAAETASENKVKVERERIATLEAANTAQGTKNEELTKAIADEKTARENAVSGEATARDNADKAIEAKIGTVDEGKTVVGMIGDAQAAAAQDATNKINDLVNNGQVATNTAAIADLEQALADEIEAREGVGDRVTTVENRLDAFFTTKDAEGNEVGLDAALDTLVEIQKYITEDGSAAGEMVEDIAANAEAIANLNIEFAEGGRVAVVEAAIDAVEADIADIEATLTGYDKDNTVKSAVDTKLAAADFTQWKTTHEAGHAETAAKITEEIGAAIDGVEAIIGGSYSSDSTVHTAIEGVNTRVGNLEAKDAELAADIAKKLDSESHLNGHAKTAAEITTEITNAVADETSARETAINGINTKISEVEGVVDGVKTTADDAQSRVAAVEPKVTALETLTAGFAEGEANGAIKTAIEAAAALGQQGINDAAAALKAAQDAQGAADKAQGEVDALEGIVAGVKTTAEDAQSRVAAVEGDYLKMADLFIIDCGSSTKNIHTA